MCLPDFNKRGFPNKSGLVENFGKLISGGALIWDPRVFYKNHKHEASHRTNNKNILRRFQPQEAPKFKNIEPLP